MKLEANWILPGYLLSGARQFEEDEALRLRAHEEIEAQAEIEIMETSKLPWNCQGSLAHRA